MKKFSLQEAIEKRKIIPFSNGPKLVGKELKGAREDLETAKVLFSRERFKSATSIAYFAIFHTGRALLYKKKYREKSHIQLAFAIKTFYVDEGFLPQEYYDNYIQAIGLREMADYKGNYSKRGAERNIRAAEEAIKRAEGVLRNKRV